MGEHAKCATIAPMLEPNNIPLSLYIHVPWCIRKCPYCDFNSHPLREALPVKHYIKALIADIQNKLHWVQQRPIHSIFIGGGTPSLLSPQAYGELFSALNNLLTIPKDCEITLEANPGTVEQSRFAGYYETGINRLSLGIQSVQDDKLKRLGRIHDSAEAITAVNAAKQAGFKNFNLDLMFGLPEQSIQDALFDLQTAIALKPSHISWYQLTLEPNTLFYKYPPLLPSHDNIWDMQYNGQKMLSKSGFEQYEISAYTISNKFCEHNLNYWRFGDYIGIGAGAHGKITDFDKQTITRHWNIKHPKQYLNTKNNFIAGTKTIESEKLAFEFMLNALRLNQPIQINLLNARTGLTTHQIQPIIDEAIAKDFIILENNIIQKTENGKRFLNDLLEIFLT